jgi:hypothetical protein
MTSNLKLQRSTSVVAIAFLMRLLGLQIVLDATHSLLGPGNEVRPKDCLLTGSIQLSKVR